MKSLVYFKITFTFLFLSILQSFATPVILFSDPENNLIIGTQVEILEDSLNKYSIHDVVLNNNFKKSAQEVPNLGISNSAFWVKFQIKNITANEDLLLELSQPIMDEVEFYAISSTNEIKVYKEGEYKKFSQRIFKDPNYIFQIKIPTNHVKTFYMKVRSKENIQVPLLVGTSKSVFELLKVKDLISGIYIGIMLVMILYNLFIYFSVKDRNYLYYVIYIVMVLLTQATSQGYSFQFLWPGSTWMATNGFYIFPSLVGIAGLAFMMDFLKAKDYVPHLMKLSYLFYLSYSGFLIIALCGYYILGFKGIEISAMMVSVYMLLVASIIYKKGYPPAKYFLIAWIAFLVGICIYVMKDFGILPYNNFTRYTMQAGSAIETVLLSFALANKINILKQEKEESQQKALEALKENDRILTEQNVTLDKMVKERTKELVKSNEELAIAIRNLKEAQAQLVNSEKMASLGQLTAGVAHEINNPINFVTSSIKPLKRDIDDLLSLLNKYEELEEKEFRKKVQEIEEFKQEIDLDYVKEEIGSLLKGMEEGASRTAEIVKGLRTFSRIDETDLKRVDLNEGIDSTLILLNSMLGDKVVVEKKYGNIEKIECFAGKMNQVFMNLLNNAIHAVLKKEEANEDKKITISTFEAENKVVVSIKDNGTGMPDKVKSKIFEPFFTTKDVGEGTGLGLSIVYNIIESHNGKIEVESEVGKGTEFIISLPKLQMTN